jgi:hypothetical protein
LPFFNIHSPQAQKVLIHTWLAQKLLIPWRITHKRPITGPIRLIVLFAGTRHKNEKIEIFLYHLFLVGTGTGKEKRTHSYEQNSIFGSRRVWETIVEFVAL